MLKKITEPQAIYQKSGVPVNPISDPEKKMKTASKVNWKIISSILVVSVVAIVGVAGVLIAQRQQQIEGPVAPNAPSSQPQAAIPEDPNRCTVSFEIKDIPEGNGKCVSKTASKIAGAVRSPLSVNSKVKRGDIIEYSVTFSTQTLAVNDKITIIDTLPIHLKYVGGQAKLDNVTTPVTVTGNTISLPISLGAGSINKQMKFTYQAQVTTDAPTTVPASTFINAVKVITNDKQDLASSCQISLVVETPVIPPSGVAKCEVKTAYNTTTTKAYTTTGTNVSMVKRGDTIEYQINVIAEKTTKGPVIVTDTLPPQLDYVANSSTWKDTVPPTGTGKVITFNMGTMAADGKKQNITIKYRAKLKADATPNANFSNSVKVVTTGAKTISAGTTCKATLKVLPEGIAKCEEKSVASSTGAVIADKSTIKKGDVISYKIKVTADQTTTGAVVISDVLPASVTYDSAVTQGVSYTTSNRTVTANLGVMGDTTANKEKTVEFKVTINDSAPSGDFVNTASVTTAGANANTCPATLRLAYACNVGCTTDEQCKSIGNDYICSTENGNTCRLASNPTSSSCEGLAQSFSCNSSCDNDSQCQQANSSYKCAATSEGNRCRHKDYETQSSCEPAATPTPTPTIGCNALCVSNADCTNPDHICYTTADDDQRCRLDEYPTATNCVEPGTTVATQPELPQELPQTGPEDWVNWLKAGLVTLGIGAVLLLLL